jgi:hypothetical protein
MLRDLTVLELRLVATHPDGHGGLAFIGQYPNAYTLFMFALSCVLGAAIAQELMTGVLATATYGYLMGVWLFTVLVILAWPLLAFRKPLADLKECTLLLSSAQATRHHRAAEREALGKTSVHERMPRQMPLVRFPTLPRCLQRPKSSLCFLSVAAHCCPFQRRRSFPLLPLALHSYRSRNC